MENKRLPKRLPLFEEMVQERRSPEFTDAEHKSARKEGWGLFDAEQMGIPLQIQRQDDLGVFETDDDAVKFVKSKAEEGSELHKKALEILKAQSPEEYERIMEAKVDPKVPKSKDIMRVNDIVKKAGNHQNNTAIGLAANMAQAIMDPDKAYRRYIAAKDKGYSKIAGIFKARYEELEKKK
jgi:hypothetical protein